MLSTRREHGASAVLLAASLVLLLGMTAIAIDVGAGFNERRIDQTSADVGAMAGALEALGGAAGVRDRALEYVALNLPTAYSASEWQTLWEGCVDPAAIRNSGGYNFTALPPPTGWTVTDPPNWCLSFDSARGLFRVRVPDQEVDTSFGRILGVQELVTHATAVARLRNRAPGGVLPFGLGANAGQGTHQCMSSGPPGLAEDPCDGATTGNFGTIKARIFGNPDIPTTTNCTASPLPQVLAQNIATGIDHVVVTDPDGLTSNEVRDLCFNAFVDTLNTDPGFPGNGAEQGLVGPVPGSYTPRLQQSGPLATINNGKQVNDVPLWSYLLPIHSGAAGDTNPDYGGTVTPLDPSDDAPASCDPDSFDDSNPPFDWNSDGTADPNESWQHMEGCLADYVSSPASSVVMFDIAIQGNAARFAYVPQFHEPELQFGNDWLHIKRFVAVYLQSTAWKSGTSWTFHNPGEACATCSGGGWAMKQLTAFVLPDESLPSVLRGSPPSGVGLNPYDVELFR